MMCLMQFQAYFIETETGPPFHFFAIFKKAADNFSAIEKSYQLTFR
jgi:hypothetical protein